MFAQIRTSATNNDGTLNFEQVMPNCKFVIDEFEKAYGDFTIKRLEKLVARLTDAELVGVDSFKISPIDNFVTPGQFRNMKLEDLRRRMNERFLTVVDFCSNIFSWRKEEWGFPATDVVEGDPNEEATSQYFALQFVLRREDNESTADVGVKRILSDDPDETIFPDEDEVKLTTEQKLDIDMAARPN